MIDPCSTSWRHILEKLKIRKRDDQINSITIAYYNESEIERYEKLIEKLELNSITNYISSKNILGE